LLDITIRNAKRRNRLSSEILDVTRLESHTFELTKEVCNLKDIIVNAMDDIILVMNIADKSRIAEVLSNLLSNAVKFTSKGTITISVELQNDKKTTDNNTKVVIVSVQDWSRN
jgi:signal transduction histidine kinase